MTIRARLTLLFGLLVASIILLFSISVFYLYNQFREQEFYQRLQDIAISTARLRQDVGPVPARDLPVLVQERVTIYDRQNRVVYNDGPVLPMPVRTLDQVRMGRSLRFRNGDVESVAVRFADKSGESLAVIASAYDQYGFSKRDRLQQILFYGWLASLVIVAVAGWLFASDALRPVAELIEQVNAISGTNIHLRLGVSRQRDELADLARTFNAMLARLEEAFVAQRSFVSYASHELRTPLTVMMGQLEVALLNIRSSAEYEATLEATLEEVRQMIDLSNGLLDLARASSDAAGLTFRPVRIDELLWQAQAALVQKNRAYQIDIDFEQFPDQEADLVLPGEESLLRTAVQNLFENGCKYSLDHRVTVRLGFNAGHINLTVSDHGSGIPADDLAHVFEPFFRAQTVVGVRGHGIGLALTRQIILLHRGQITIHSVVGQGTTVEVSLPTGPL
jgi:signal transduction histidine kinase